MRNIEQELHRSKSEVIVSAIAQYLGAVEDVPLTQRMIDLEKRLAILETEVKHLAEVISSL